MLTFHLLVILYTWGVLGKEAKELLQEVGHRVMEESGDTRSYGYRLQRISVAIQHGNAAVVLGTSHIPRNDFDRLDW